jgi:opacity protein-like surface antigen
MNKMFGPLAILLMAPIAICAQISSVELDAGPSYNFAWKDHGTIEDTIETLTKLNYTLGGLVNFGMGPAFELQTGLRYATKGQRYEYCHANATGTDYECFDKYLIINLNYIEIPLALRYHFMQSEAAKVFAMAGVQYGFASVKTDNYADILAGSGSADSRYNNGDLSLLAGLGISRKIGKNMSVNFTWRGEFGLLDILSDSPFPEGAAFDRGTSFAYENLKGRKHKLTGVQFGFQYHFAKKEKDGGARK